MNKWLNLSTIVLAALLLGVLAVLSVAGMIDPAASAGRFGVPAAEPAAQFYHAVYRDRNLVLAVIGIVFLASRMWRPLAILSTASVSLPLYDIFALQAIGVAIAQVHSITAGALTMLSAMLWWKLGADARKGLSAPSASARRA